MFFRPHSIQPFVDLANIFYHLFDHLAIEVTPSWYARGLVTRIGVSRRFQKSGTQSQNILMVYQLWTSAKKSDLEVSNHLRLGLFILLLWIPL